VLHKPGLIPQQFGFKKGDFHLIVNATSKKLKCFDFTGKLIFTIACLADGMHPNFRESKGDTPPGLYKIGVIYNDYKTYGANPPNSHDINAYGWGFADLVDLGSPDGEDINGRAGVALHGGGTGLGFPGCWEAFQPLLHTWGCVRFHNHDFVNKILPLKTSENTVFVSVYQDDK
jgi:hypothetical protein